MMKRFETGSEFFQDHELLEVLLFNAIPRGNTNPIAHALIKSFGSLAGVFKASIKELMLVQGIGEKTAEYLHCLGLCFDRITPAPKGMPQYFTPKAFCDFLEEEYAGKPKEVLEIFCLNKVERLLFRKEFSIGKKDEVSIDPREVSALLLVMKPHTIVVAHNHPNGSRNPSPQDDVFTKRLYMLCFMNNVRLGDHVIVGQDGSFSYHATGRLDKIKASCKDINADSDGVL